ncbi:MAG: hypothetical protein ABSB01_00500 [Streptosporangiaceae bacterium]|jgi:hypothetical protein
MFGHLCVFDFEGACGCVGVDDGVEGGDDDAWVAVVAVVDVVVDGADEPGVAALATPATPAPRPPARAAVTTRRRSRVPVLDAIQFLLPERVLAGPCRTRG